MGGVDTGPFIYHGHDGRRRHVREGDVVFWREGDDVTFSSRAFRFEKSGRESWSLLAQTLFVTQSTRDSQPSCAGGSYSACCSRTAA